MAQGKGRSRRKGESSSDAERGRVSDGPGNGPHARRCFTVYDDIEAGGGLCRARSGRGFECREDTLWLDQQGRSAAAPFPARTGRKYRRPLGCETEKLPQTAGKEKTEGGGENCYCPKASGQTRNNAAGQYHRTGV